MNVVLINGESTQEMSFEDAESILKPLSEVFSKEQYISKISELHDHLVLKLLEENNYKDFAELNSWAQEPINQYYEEANAIKSWYRETWLLIERYADVVTEQSALTPEEFINNLPTLNKPI